MNNNSESWNQSNVVSFFDSHRMTTSDIYPSEWFFLKDELQAYNPELLHKEFILSITKSDMLDEELKEEIRQELAINLKGIPFLFISAVAQTGLLELKDEIWKLLQDD